MASARFSRLRSRGTDGLFVLISGSLLAVCVFYTVAYVYFTPISGITTTGDWVVTYVDACGDYPGWCETEWGGPEVVRDGDQLSSIGGLAFQDYITDRRLVRFAGYREGDTVPIVLSRGGASREIKWRMPPITAASQRQRLYLALFYLPFWFVGTLVMLSLRPRGERWRLLIAINYLTAIWTVSGAISTSHVAGSSLLLHAITWIIVPLYLHFHLVAPSSLLRSRHRVFVGIAYGIGLILAVLELYQLLANSAFYLGLLAAVLGSAALLLYRLFGKAPASDRPAVRLMLIGIALSLGPGIILWIVPYLLSVDMPWIWATEVSAAAIPILPLFYAYALYKRYLGALELHTHRFLSLYGFVLLYGTLWTFVLLIGQQRVSPGNVVSFVSVTSELFAIGMQPLHTGFRRLLDHMTYGVSANQQDLLPSLIGQIHSAQDLDALFQLLAETAAPSFAIRQSALYVLGQGTTSLRHSQQVHLPHDPLSSQRTRELLSWASQYRPPLSDAEDEFDWVRLVIPMRTRKEALGLWLFGQRDPDDYYPQHVIASLDALGSQAAVSIENISLYDRAQQEIAERERAEEALQQSKETARALLNASNEAALLAGRSGEVLAANRAASEMFGRPEDVLVGRHYAHLHHEPVPDELIESREQWFREVIRSGKQVGFQDEYAEKVLDNGYYPILDARGEVARVAIFSRDITASKQAERQAIQDERLRATGRLAAALAHEINNPLQAIRSNLELVTGFELGQKESRECVLAALTEVERLATITERALNFARPTERAGTAVGVPELVQRTLALADRHLRQAGIKVAIAVPSDLPPLVVAAEQIVQVLLNLLLNAVQAMPDGGHVQIAAHVESEMVAVNVSNDGPPVLPDDLPHIFDAFYTTKSYGMGLGLSVCRSIVEHHGGTIGLENLADGEGVVVRVALPIALRAERGMTAP